MCWQVVSKRKFHLLLPVIPKLRKLETAITTTSMFTLQRMILCSPYRALSEHVKLALMSRNTCNGKNGEQLPYGWRFILDAKTCISGHWTISLVSASSCVQGDICGVISTEYENARVSLVDVMHLVNSKVNMVVWSAKYYNSVLFDSNLRGAMLHPCFTTFISFP